MKIYSEDDGLFEWFGKFFIFNVILLIIGLLGSIFFGALSYNLEEKTLTLTLNNFFIFMTGTIILAVAMNRSKAAKKKVALSSKIGNEDAESQLKMQFAKDIKLIDFFTQKNSKPQFYQDLNKKNQERNQLKKQIKKYHDYILENEEMKIISAMQKIKKEKKLVAYLRYISLFLIAYSVINFLIFT